MPWGLLTSHRSENLGDEIQAIAASTFLPRIDTLVDRDALDMHRVPDTRMLLNGWFLLGEAWPPPAVITPLVVSFYATEERPDVLSPRLVAWYRRHEPIGCRSKAMLARVEALGLRAYFSGCLTLCLPPRPGPPPSDGPTLIVDCDAAPLRQLVPARVVSRARFLTHVALSDAASLGRRLARRALAHGRAIAPRLAWELSARWRMRRHHERMEQARALLAAYSGAKLVITSRLHCFLPCLALGTPVVLLHTGADGARFSGLAELGRSYTLRDDRVDIDWDDPAPNPGRHLALAAQLATTCRAWVAAHSDPTKSPELR